MDISLDEAIKHALDGNALLITGAGFSASAINALGNKMPLANDLVCKIYQEICKEPVPDSDDRESLADLADRCIQEGNGLALCNLMEQCYTQKPSSTAECKSREEVIVNLPWRRIYTTNYDNVIENLSIECGLKRTPVMLCDNYETYIRKNHKNVIVHINGFIKRLTQDILGSDFKLSASSYLINSFAYNDWIRLLKSDIDAASAVILVGVSSNSDLDLNRLIYNNGQYRDKVLFIDFKEKAHDSRKKFGSVFYVGVDGFADKITEIKKTYIPRERTIRLTCFEEFKTNPRHGNINVDSSARRRLFEHGQIDDSILECHVNDNSYLFARSCLADVETAFSNSTVQCVCITSSLANGKTCFSKLLGQHLLIKGWDVFSFSHDNTQFQQEIDFLQETEKPTLIIFESYHLYFSILSKMLRLLESPKIKFLFTSRTSIHASVSHRITSDLGIADSSIREFNLDILDDSELKCFVSLLDKGDYLLSMKGFSNSKKAQKIRKTCNSTIKDTLIEYVHSPAVTNEIDKACIDICKDSTTKKIAYACFITSLLDLHLSANELLTILEVTGLPASTSTNRSFSELIDFSGGKFRSNSSIVSQYVLQKLSVKDLMQYLFLMERNAQRLFSESNLRAIRTSFVTYSNINLLCGKKKRTDTDNRDIVEYYYHLSQAEIYDDNPFFWLQYAISCMEIHDYKRAGELIEKSYSCCTTRPHFDAFQIDTQNARLILEEVTYESSVPCGDAFNSLKHAEQLFQSAKRHGSLPDIIKQIAQVYPKFFHIYCDSLSYEQCNTLLGYVKDWIKTFNDYNSSVSKSRRNSRCIKQFQIDLLIGLQKDIIGKML